MQTDSLNIIEGLKPLHEPEAVAFWPPGPGWYLVGVLILGLIAFGIVRAARWWRGRQYRRTAVNTLEAWKKEAGALSVIIVNDLLKRVALKTYPREQVASLTGQAWLEFLSETARIPAFTEAPGRTLIEGLYRKDPLAVSGKEKNELLDLAIEWVKNHDFAGTDRQHTDHRSVADF